MVWHNLSGPFWFPGEVTAHPNSTTKFAYPITTGMAFNRSLWRATGNQIGTHPFAMMVVTMVVVVS